MADDHFLERALMNLLNNALKYAKSKVTINAYEQKGIVYISVEDDGDGVSGLFAKKYLASLDQSRAAIGIKAVQAWAWQSLPRYNIGMRVIIGSDFELGAKFVLSYPQKNEIELLLTVS